MTKLLIAVCAIDTIAFGVVFVMQGIWVMISSIIIGIAVLSWSIVTDKLKWL